MNTLENLISQISDISSLDAVYSNLTAKTNKIVVYDGEQSIAAIEKKYGTEFSITLVVGMKTVIDTLINANQTQAADYLSIYFDRVTRGIGLNFADDTVQNRLNSLSEYLTQEVVDKLKAMGSVYKSKWQLNSSDPEPTIEEVEIARQNVIKRRIAGAYWPRVLAVVNPMIDAGNSAEEIKAAVIGVE